MAFVKTDDAHYKGIAGAIRAIHGKEDTYTPPEMVAFLTEGGVDIKPEHIAKDITIFGVTGTLEFSVTEEFPPYLPKTEDEADDEVKKKDPSAPVEDKFVLMDNLGNETIGIMYGDDFKITYYDPVTTEFKARGWLRTSWHTTGDLANTWTTDDFRATASGGWNYLKNLRCCTRKKLYYGDLVIWPRKQQYEEWPNTIVYRPDNPGDTGGSYNLHLLKGEANTSFVWGSSLTLTVREPVEGG